MVVGGADGGLGVINFKLMPCYVLTGCRLSWAAVVVRSVTSNRIFIPAVSFYSLNKGKDRRL